MSGGKSKHSWVATPLGESRKTYLVKCSTCHCQASIVLTRNQIITKVDILTTLFIGNRYLDINYGDWMRMLPCDVYLVKYLHEQ